MRRALAVLALLGLFVTSGADTALAHVITFDVVAHKPIRLGDGHGGVYVAGEGSVAQCINPYQTHPGCFADVHGTLRVNYQICVPTVCDGDLVVWMHVEEQEAFSIMLNPQTQPTVLRALNGGFAAYDCQKSDGAAFRIRSEARLGMYVKHGGDGTADGWVWSGWDHSPSVLIPCDG